jgi:hypothetical protein
VYLDLVPVFGFGFGRAAFVGTPNGGFFSALVEGYFFKNMVITFVDGALGVVGQEGVFIYPGIVFVFDGKKPLVGIVGFSLRLGNGIACLRQTL